MVVIDDKYLAKKKAKELLRSPQFYFFSILILSFIIVIIKEMSKRIFHEDSATFFLFVLPVMMAGYYLIVKYIIVRSFEQNIAIARGYILAISFSLNIGAIFFLNRDFFFNYLALPLRSSPWVLVWTPIAFAFKDFILTKARSTSNQHMTLFQSFEKIFFTAGLKTAHSFRLGRKGLRFIAGALVAFIETGIWMGVWVWIAFDSFILLTQIDTITDALNKVFGF